MSSNCSYCSDCFQTGPHKSTVGVNGYSYIQMHDFNNNDNNKPIKLPAIWPKPPTRAQQGAINARVPPAPFNLPDYFQDYQYYNTSNNEFNTSLENAYPLPNNKCAKEKTNLWTVDEVEKKLDEFPDLKEFMQSRSICGRFYNNLHQKENWRDKLSIPKLTEILSWNYVFKYYPHDYMREVLKYYICNH